MCPNIWWYIECVESDKRHKPKYFIIQFACLEQFSFSVQCSVFNARKVFVYDDRHYNLRFFRFILLHDLSTPYGRSRTLRSIYSMLLGLSNRLKNTSTLHSELINRINLNLIWRSKDIRFSQTETVFSFLNGHCKVALNI